MPKSSPGNENWTIIRKQLQEEQTLDWNERKETDTELRDSHISSLYVPQTNVFHAEKPIPTQSLHRCEPSRLASSVPPPCRTCAVFLSRLTSPFSASDLKVIVLNSILSYYTIKFNLHGSTPQLVFFSPQTWLWNIWGEKKNHIFYHLQYCNILNIKYS